MQEQKEIHLTKKDFRIEWYSGTGAGGQHRNKHMNCCRIIHIETGLKAQGVDSRSRVENQRNAFNKLAKLILSYYAVPPEQRRQHGELVRKYHAVDNYVQDVATGTRDLFRNVVEKGDLSEMIESRARARTSD